jgi:hypothetical protein
VKYKVCELEGALLDAAVAAALGERYDGLTLIRWIDGGPYLSPAVMSDDCAEMFEPSREWAHGGPIIEREQIGLTYIPTNDLGDAAFWCASILRDPASERTKLFEGFHASPLVAAMRAFVASKLGDEIDLPTGEDENRGT